MARLKPLPRSQRKLVGALKASPIANRAQQLSRKKDTVKDVSVGLMDIDAAIMYYFNEVIKPTIVENGEVVKVPVYYANPERWKTIQRQGYLRDSKKQLITPLIAFKRNSITKDDSITIDKMNPEDPKLRYTFERKYTQENRYDRFSVLQGRTPSREFYTVAMPDYMKMTYECIIWTSYIEQMNKIVERINWSGGSSWGEPGKFKFIVTIDSFDDATEMGDNERLIKTTFSFSFRGYLVPKEFNNFMLTNKSFSPKTLKILDESSLHLSSIFSPDTNAQTVRYTTGVQSGLGAASDFIRGIAGQVGNQIQDLEFTNTYGGETMYIMRSSGEPSSSTDTKSVLSLGYANTAYFVGSQRFAGNESSSAASSSFATYVPTLDSNKRMKSGTVYVLVNGLDLSSNTNQTDSTNVDFYLNTNQRHINISKLGTSGIGINMLLSDSVLVGFQQEVS